MKFLFINEPCLTLARVGSAGSINFFDNGCYIGDKAMALILKRKFAYHKNQSIYLFLKVILNANKFRFSYARGIVTEKYKELKIVLPVKENGKINFDYIETFVRERERGIQAPLWSVFKIGKLFNIKRGKRIVRDEDYFKIKDAEFSIPVITSTTMNNSIDGYYLKHNCNGHVICCGGEASGMYSTYQKSKCWVMDRSRILKPKFPFSKYLAMFFITIFNMEQYRFSYGKSANPDDIEHLKIILPISDCGDPDWEYMENYIKSLPYSKYL